MRKFVIVLFIILLLGFDMFSKYFFEHVVDIREYVPIISEYLGLKLSYNIGVAFSFPIRGILLQVITLLILVGLGHYYIRKEHPKQSSLLDAGYVLIFAGALSHAYERIFTGHVVDFISVKYFAILNFADIFISIGAMLLLFAYVRLDRKYR